MSKRILVEDSLLAVTIVCLFSFIFSFTHAFQNDVQQNVAITDPVTIQPSPLIITPEPKTIIPIHASTMIVTTATNTPEIQATSTEKEKVEPTEKVIPVVTKTPAPDKKVSVPAAEPIITKATVTPTQSVTKSDFTQKLVSLIEDKTNTFRLDHNLDALHYENTLERNAEKYSQTMLNGDFLSHTNNNGCDLTCRFNADGYKATAWGENLAVLNFDELPSAEEVASIFMSQWQKSAGHRENLLSPLFTHQGIGVAFDNDDVYVTVDFSKPIK